MKTKKTPSPAGRIGFLHNGRSMKFYVGEDTIEKTTRVGNGNRSEGLRIMIEAFDESTLPEPEYQPETKKRRIRPAVPSDILGRPATVKNGRSANYTVGEDHVEKILRIGQGNMSAGMRLAVEAYEEDIDGQPN